MPERYRWKDYATAFPFQQMLVVALALLAGCKEMETSEVPDASAVSVSAGSAGETSAASIRPDGQDSSSPQPGVPQHETQAEPSFYTVAHYDLQADPAQQLQATLARAKSEHKTVLLQVGGDWCGWCTLMSQFMQENEAVNKQLHDSYLVQKVTYDSANRNEEFLGDYPSISGYPHLFVLDSEGKLLHSQNTAELEEGQGYNEQAFLEFLNQWKPHKSGV